MANEKFQIKRGAGQPPAKKVPGQMLVRVDTGELFVDESTVSRVQIQDPHKIPVAQFENDSKSITLPGFIPSRSSWFIGIFRSDIDNPSDYDLNITVNGKYTYSYDECEHRKSPKTADKIQSGDAYLFLTLPLPSSKPLCYSFGCINSANVLDIPQMQEQLVELANQLTELNKSFSKKVFKSINSEVYYLERHADYSDDHEDFYKVMETSSASGYTTMTLLIREAIEFAHNHGYRTVLFPSKLTITVGLDSTTGGVVANGGIVMTVPKNLVIDLNGCTIQLNPNNYTKKEYVICRLYGDYSEIRNGTLIGDYAKPSGLAQWGHGVTVGGSYCKVENLKIQNFLGDGMYISSEGMTKISLANSTLWTADTANGCIYTSLIDISSLVVNGETEMKVRVQSTTADFLPFCKIEFYNSSKSLVSSDNLKTQTSVMATDIMIPDNSKYVKVYIYSRDFLDETIATDFINSSSRGDSYLRGCTMPCRGNLINNVIIKHIGRNGITLGLTNQTTISNFVISDVNGTAPKACIDVEEGRNEGYNCTIKNGWMTNAGFGIAFSGNIGLIIENLLATALGITLYGYSTQMINVKNSILVGGLECGSQYLANSKIENSIIMNDICTYNFDYVGCDIYTGRINLGGNCTCRNSKISVIDIINPTINIAGTFENCLFDGENIAFLNFQCDNTRIKWETVNSSLYNCRIKDFFCVNFQSDKSDTAGLLVIDTISGCHISVRQLDNIAAKQVVNSTFEYDCYNGSSFQTIKFNCGFISGCLFDRSLNSSGNSVSDQCMMWIDNSVNAYVPEAFIITNNRFIGMVSTSDYALGVSDVTIPVYFNNNYGLQKTIDETTTCQLTAVKVNDTTTTTSLNSTNNYGFKQ